MKRFLCLALVLPSLLLCACRKDGGYVKTDLEKYVQTHTTTREEELMALCEGLFTPETEYRYGPDDDSLTGLNILRAGNLGFNQTYRDRFFFMVPGENGTLNKYLDPKTGEALFLCDDPTCPHNARQHTTLDMSRLVIPDNSTPDGKLYVSLMGEVDYAECIAELKPDNTLEYIYTTSLPQTLKDGVTASSFLFNVCVYHGYFCFGERIDYYDAAKASNDIDMEYYFKVVDAATGEVVYSEQVEQNSPQLVGISDTHLLFLEPDTFQYYVTDHQRENRRDLFPGSQYVTITWDSITQEYFALVAAPGDDGEMEQNLYTYDADWQLIQKLPMPSEKIISALVTRNYIYYQKYMEPIEYGVGLRTQEIVTRYDGNKIFRVARETADGHTTVSPTEELIFDGGDKIFYGLYMVIGDYLYLKYNELCHEGDYVYWNLTGEAARIHIKDKTIHWFTLS